MSFRGRLRLFFALIVIVPMLALGLVLFALVERTETGKADAGVGTATRTAVAVHGDQMDAARPALKRVAADPRLQSAIVHGHVGAARQRLRELVRGNIVAIELWSRSGRRLARAGSDAAWRGAVRSAWEGAAARPPPCSSPSRARVRWRVASSI